MNESQVLVVLSQYPEIKFFKGSNFFLLPYIFLNDWYLPYFSALNTNTQVFFLSLSFFLPCLPFLPFLSSPFLPSFFYMRFLLAGLLYLSFSANNIFLPFMSV